MQGQQNGPHSEPLSSRAPTWRASAEGGQLDHLAAAPDRRFERHDQPGGDPVVREVAMMELPQYPV